MAPRIGCTRGEIAAEHICFHACRHAVRTFEFTRVGSLRQSGARKLSDASRCLWDYCNHHVPWGGMFDGKAAAGCAGRVARGGAGWRCNCCHCHRRRRRGRRCGRRNRRRNRRHDCRLVTANANRVSTVTAAYLTTTADVAASTSTATHVTATLDAAASDAAAVVAISFTTAVVAASPCCCTPMLLSP